MSYRDTDNYQPLGRQRRSTRTEKTIAVLAIIAALFMLLSAYAHAKSAPPVVKALDFGSAPFGLVLIGIGCTYVARARGGAEERYSRRTLLLTALLFFVLGGAVIAIGINDHFERLGHAG